MGHWRKQELSIFITSNCNLLCHYCYMPHMNIASAHQVIDFDFAKAGIEYFFSTNPSRTIRFFASGEATQAFPMMEKIYNFAKWLAGAELKIELQTNGYFGEEIADWIATSVNILWLSCDGAPATQDAQRPVRGGRPSSSVILKNIARFSKLPDMQFGIRSTIKEENLACQVELVEYFHDLGVTYLCAAPTYHSTVKPTVQTPPLLVFAKNFVPAFYRAKELGMEYLTHLIVNFDEKVEYYCRALTPCPQLTTDGYVSCCDWASFGSKYLQGPLQELIYGQFDPDTQEIIIDQEKLSRLTSRKVDILSQNGCQGCPALRHCAGGCVGKMIAATGDLYKATPEWCAATRYLFQQLPVNKGLYRVLHS